MASTTSVFKPTHQSITPTRTEFLAMGLTPVLISDLPKDAECNICLENEFTDPVKLPCRHIFDKVCIETWLKMDGRNSCPLCKSRLFDLGGDEDRGPPATLREQVVEAIRTSHLSEPNATRGIVPYGGDITRHVTRPSLQRATAHAACILAQETRPAPGALIMLPRSDTAVNIVGPAVIRCDSIHSHFLAMSNLIPALASAQGRQYTWQQSDGFNLAVNRLWSVLRETDNKTMDVAKMVDKLDRGVHDSLRKKHYLLACELERIEYFFAKPSDGQHNVLREDWMLLLNYLAVWCWKIHQDEEEVAKKEREAELARRRAGQGQHLKKGCVIM